jgi:hypothetical protein
MMKFVILREAVIQGQTKKKCLVEWDESQIFKVFEEHYNKPNVTIREAWLKTIAEFKKETIKIP